MTLPVCLFLTIAMMLYGCLAMAPYVQHDESCKPLPPPPPHDEHSNEGSPSAMSEPRNGASSPTRTETLETLSAYLMSLSPSALPSDADALLRLGERVTAHGVSHDAVVTATRQFAMAFVSSTSRNPQE